MTLLDAPDHADLITAIAQDRDRAAFARLFRHFAPRLKAFAMRGGLSGDAAEEIMQEAMVAVWRKAYSYDRQKASPSTWIFTIIRNKRIDYLRRERKPAFTAEDFIHEETTEEGADQSVAVNQELGVLSDRMKTLPPDQMEVIQKAFLEEKSHSQVADELGLPLGTVKSRIRLAITRLRGLMEKE
ncbi:sigma-70 family RNA polymerase sigma factor [Yunchengibacter salinarum]|uniref:sigma-70 family RNA polymerase sigma factor n=1 Tax=Yunchengibacter salinarum TaxID=3133399 RepID=UPI0035B65E62